MTDQRHNLFLAVQPGAKANAAIDLVMDRLRPAHGCGLPEIRPDCRHISLLSLSEEDELSHWLLKRAKAALATVKMSSFAVTLNRVMSWKPRVGHVRRPLVLLGDDGVIGVDMLRREIHAALADAGLKPRRFQEEIPHLTLAYVKSELKEEIVLPVHWTVREFVLIDSLVGEGRHIVLNRWPLA